MKTNRNLDVTASQFGVARIEEYHQQILSTGKYPEIIIDAVAQEPETFLLQVYAATYFLYAQRNIGIISAQEHLLEAEKQLSQVNHREQLIFYAVDAWAHNDYIQALCLFKSVAQLYPRDTLAVKFAEWLYYCCGQKYYAQDYLALCEAVYSHNEDDPSFLAMYAFAQELVGHRLKAEQEAQRALILNPHEAWAQHCLAHVYHQQGQFAEGINALENWRVDWENISPLLIGHNLWHLALFYIANRQGQQAINLLPQILGMFPEVVVSHIDAISLLWRLELAGFSQPQWLKKLAHIVESAASEHFTGFNTLHYIYCLAHGGDEIVLNKALADLKLFAFAQAGTYSGTLWQEGIFPFCKAIVACTHEEYEKAYELIQPNWRRYLELGGSDAQGEVFAQSYFLCLLRLGKNKEAKDVFEQSLAHYQNTPLAQSWFDQAQR